MGVRACTESQCLHKGVFYVFIVKCNGTSHYLLSFSCDAVWYRNLMALYLDSIMFFFLNFHPLIYLGLLVFSLFIALNMAAHIPCKRMKPQIILIWGVTQCVILFKVANFTQWLSAPSPHFFYSENVGSGFLWNVGTCLTNYLASLSVGLQ